MSVTKVTYWFRNSVGGVGLEQRRVPFTASGRGVGAAVAGALAWVRKPSQVLKANLPFHYQQGTAAEFPARKSKKCCMCK